MAKDDRLYGRFTLDFADSPKIAPLSDGAFRALVEMALYSRRMLSDGFISERVAGKFWQVSDVDELCSNDPERPSLQRVSGGFMIHDFSEHQTTKADIEAKREAGRKGGLAKASRNIALATDVLQQKSNATLAKTETETITTSNEVVNNPPTPLGKGGRKTSSSHGERLSETWKPSDDSIAAITSEHPGFDYQSEHKVFADYWASVPGQKGKKLSWDSTWRNWMRRAARQSYSPSRAPLRRITNAETALQQHHKLFGGDSYDEGRDFAAPRASVGN
ncbi:hypothetical protein [Lysinibacter sp. HNR]|uniref:hypothetical protein n=1 Tax=Lysinibacter sp. HNR TaxID=3031408 RepID=UPI002434D4F3|nr:hypothetical protein [Lysinibacter sp. HNR]WGD36823.1 hypothetical protein FrondiHNR_10230 [Lysinibacter sp. HNR]